MKHKGRIILFITVEGIKHTQPKDIANHFGRFYSTLSSTLATKIVPGTTHIDDYLGKIPKQEKSLVLKQTTPQKLIRGLPNKSSHGHDQISNIMLNHFSLVPHLQSHSIAKGRFPDLMKRAEVIPLYKGKEMDVMVNY